MRDADKLCDRMNPRQFRKKGQRVIPLYDYVPSAKIRQNNAMQCNPSAGKRCRRNFLEFLALLLLICATPFARATADGLVWGTSAINLKSPLPYSPSLNDLLTNDAHAAPLNLFYLAGGENRAAAPTECRIAYDKDNLFVVFRCSEDNLSFPAVSHKEDWYSLLISPSDQDGAFPDKVDFFIQPDMHSHTFYQFAATLDGSKFGYRHGLHSKSDEPAKTDEDSTTTSASSQTAKVGNFTAIVTKGTNEWLVFFTIPWSTIGGKSADYFGILPIRTRWRDGEVSSPVAMDFNERPPTDLFIETHFSGIGPIQESKDSLIQLPSGILRWQKPASLSYPTPEEVCKIWDFQQSLSKPSTTNDFARRLYLTQRWMDLLTIEGFNFRPGGGGIVPQEMTPSTLRHNINAALLNTNTAHACQLLDAYLKKLDKASRQWFADGSPGDISQNDLQAISQLESTTTSNNVLLMLCLAGDRHINLHLSLPASGGVRIYGDNEGYFTPTDLLPLNLIPSNDSFSINTTNGRVVIEKTPFAISFYDTAGNQVFHLGTNDVAFRFDQQGKMVATDFKSHLDRDEVIYGFGERYDHFNQNGRILTLWGMDDWVGNTIGLLNQTYKPIPIYHSSKQYMVFDNSSYRLRADIGKTRPDELRLTQEGPIFDYYFWVSSPAKALESYTELTGKPVLPPKWAFGAWMGRTGRGWNKPSHDMVAEEEKVTEQFEKLDIPHSAIYAEGGGNAESPKLNAFMAERGMKVFSWFYPVISQATQAKVMPDKKPGELPVLHTTDPWDHVDFSNPNAVELMRRVWSQRLNAGVAGSMIDFGDRVTEDAVFFNGKRGAEMHNFYSYDYHRTCSEVFREKRGDDFILFGRAAAPGTQKWVAQFGGDHASNFQGLRAVLTGALNLSSCGFSTWGSDLGGFLGWPEPAVYMRWTQFGCFSPLMRSHGRTPREPWNFGEAAVANYKHYVWVRENLLNYIYNAAIEAHESGIPMMRSMAVAFADEPALAAVSDQYMFGPDLLVAPVTTGDNSRTVYFPSGHWVSLWNGQSVSDTSRLTMDVPLGTIPVYLKSGAVVPAQLNSSLQFGESMSHGRVNTLIITAPESDQPMSLHDEQEHQADAEFQQTANGFELVTRDFPATDYLLLYGRTVGNVLMDGQPLPKMDPASPASMPTGWYIDPQMTRLIIHLPPASEHKNHTFKFVF